MPYDTCSNQFGENLPHRASRNEGSFKNLAQAGPELDATGHRQFFLCNGFTAHQPLAPLAALIMLLLIVITAIAVGGAENTNGVGAKPDVPHPQDWHGNAMRSQWGR